jgi:hypothetical protein
MTLANNCSLSFFTEIAACQALDSMIRHHQGQARVAKPATLLGSHCSESSVSDAFSGDSLENAESSVGKYKLKYMCIVNQENFMKVRKMSDLAPQFHLCTKRVCSF